MKGLLLRWLALTFAIVIASYLLDGIRVSSFFSAIFTAAILGILNAFLRPILFIVTLPLTVLTFGLFTFVINAVWSAVFGSLLISIVSWLLNSFISERGRVDYIDLHHKGGNRWE